MLNDSKVPLHIRSSMSTSTEPLHVSLVGDSVLDNFFWVWHAQQDVRAQLEGLLRRSDPGAYVTNLAVDESTIGCVLHGSYPGEHYQCWRKLCCMKSYPKASDGRVYPLEKLSQLEPDVAVLAIGGNDARSAFAQTMNIDSIYDIMIRRGIIRDFNRLVDEILTRVAKLVLVIVYHPQITCCPFLHMLPPASVVTELIVRFSPMFIDTAKRCNLPIVDLSRSFNPYNPFHYGSTPIEPSNCGGMIIAKLVNWVLDDFKWDGGTGKIYSQLGSHREIYDLDDRFDDKATYFRRLMSEHLQRSRRAARCSRWVFVPYPRSMMFLLFLLLIIILLKK